jgi:hypothetical protein
MSHVADFLAPSDLRRIANLQIFARQVVEGFCSGLHRSPHKGFSVEFKQHRQYVPGDEIKHIDWRVFGRSDRFYIREYEEETNLRATLILDRSGSMGYAGKTGVTKFEYGTKLAACLSYLMLQQSDSVGMVTFDTEIRRFIPPRSRVSHLAVLIEELENGKVGGETEIGHVFHDLVPKLHRRGLLVIISDCFGRCGDLPPGDGALPSRLARDPGLPNLGSRRARFPFQRLDPVRVSRACWDQAYARPGPAEGSVPRQPGESSATN